MRHFLLFLLFCLPAGWLSAQTTYPVNGTKPKESTTYVLTGATIHSDAETTFAGALVVQNGTIVALGNEVGEYPNAVRIDLSGYHIYPGFVDLYTSLGMPDTPRPKRNPYPQDLSSKKGAFGWNEAIRPEVRASDHYSSEERADAIKAMRKAGFGAAVTHVQDGIMRGSGALIALDERDNYAMLQGEIAAFASFRKGSSTQDYPSSLMGVIALLRQTWLDAEWYANSTGRRENNLSLEALNRINNLPWIFECNDKLDVLRADAIGEEFNKQFIFKEKGDSYQRIDAIAKTGGALVLSLEYPEAMDVSDPYLARLVSLTDLKHWELAPMNAVTVHRANIPFAFTTDGLKDPAQLLPRIRRAIELGLPESAALDAITKTPAQLIGADDRVGSLGIGMLANFIVTNGPLFDATTAIYESWVLGEQEVFIDRDLQDLSGRYDLTGNGVEFTLFINGKPGSPTAKIEHIDGNDTTTVSAKISQDAEQFILQFGPHKTLFAGVYRLSGNAFGDSRILKGAGQSPDGTWFSWAAVRTSDHDKPEKYTPEAAADSIGSLIYPFVAYGRSQLPNQETLLIKNATIWTNEAEGIIENGQLLIHQGKIVAVGKTIIVEAAFGKNAPEITVYDAEGKHVTAGIIDEHSHIAISRGVNEGTQASSAEVSIASVVNSEDVNIYRQLSGGVTAAQLLHGSANPIGGQSAIVKLLWGATPEEMKIEDAEPFIKFALGENVKQSNWGQYYTSRFPQTRMGVEQVYYDHFIRAKEYEAEWAAYNALAGQKRRRRSEPQPPAPRRDLELEVILQIVNSERFISCHSYRQDEINMLMHVADSMGFTVNTFTHILEGYKVADKMVKHGAGGSSFSDWWAYKYEVKDAIPHNGAILWSQGVVTAFNSDDAEMARRLNQEAAKAFKYGGVPEEEAFKFVTLNPAKLLHLDHRMGSLAVGKDADIVIWSDHPLSIYAKAEATFVDGRRMFDRQEDLQLREGIRAERARLVQKMLDEGGGKGPKPSEKVPQHYHCETITDEIR